jgi:hypothetical protein
VTKYLLPELPGFMLKGRLLYRLGNEWIVQGIFFESSAFDKQRLAVHAFVQPLYVPADSLVLTLGRRLPSSNGQWWDMAIGGQIRGDEILQSIRQQGLDLLEMGRSPDQLLRNLGKFLTDLNSEYALEVSGLSRLLIGDDEGSRQDLRRLRGQLARINDQVGWIQDLRRRAEQIEMETQTDPAVARIRLASWRDETLRNLRLPPLTS